jgi:DNA-binding NarL/FixJ family response regulator
MTAMEAPSTPATPDRPDPVSHAQTIRVLVADDHSAVRIGLMQLLDAQPDFDVAACVDAESAVAHALAHPIDVVVVDYQMPGRNGLWACRELKRAPAAPGVVVFSAFADHHLAACCAVAQADAVLNKGALGSELCAAIRSVARGHRLLPRVAPQLVDGLRRRLGDSEQLLFGMLLAAIPGDEICSVLNISHRELDSRITAMLRIVEVLPGERSASTRTRSPLDVERGVRGRRAASARG